MTERGRPSEDGERTRSFGNPFEPVKPLLIVGPDCARAGQVSPATGRRPGHMVMSAPPLSLTSPHSQAPSRRHGDLTMSSDAAVCTAPIQRTQGVGGIRRHHHQPVRRYDDMVRSSSHRSPTSPTAGTTAC